jgi:putative component of membrane protein insertase Oxa1/YidC/SpoIIIJ protein YidD
MTLRFPLARGRPVPVRYPHRSLHQRPMRELTLWAISVYQRYVSPYKGFRCAYGYHTGCASCSHLGYRAVRWHGLRRGLRLLFQRFARCAEADARYGPGDSKPTTRSPMSGQRGYCDIIACVPCDAGCATPCDAASCPAMGDACGTAFCPTPCDCATWYWDRRSVKETYVPPRRSRERTEASVDRVIR